MNYLGSDFNSSGSVMAKAELTVARTKRGECVTCGRKCYRKKLFKMIPLDEPGKVLNGRCLNCKPLQPKDVSVLPLSDSNSHSTGNNPGDRSYRSITNSSSFDGESNRRMAMRKKKKSSHRNHKSSSHLLKSNYSTNGNPKSPPGRTHSTPLSTTRRHYNSSHSNLSRTTVDTAMTTRPSIVSISTKAARKNMGSISTLSLGSASSMKVTVNSTKKVHNHSTSGRTLDISENFGTTFCETTNTKSSEISWTPPPNHFELGSSNGGSEDVNENYSNIKSNANVRAPNRINSYKSTMSSASKHYPPTREELERAALTLMAAREHGLTGVGGPLYEDMFEELASTDQNQYSGDNDSDSNTKPKSDITLHSSLIESVPNARAEHRLSLPKNSDKDQDFEQNSSIAESNVCNPKTASTAEDADLVLSPRSRQRTFDHPKQGLLNRGGAFQPRNGNSQGKAGPGTYVSIGTMSSMSSIGEDDHLYRKNSLEQKNIHVPNRRSNLPRIGSFSRYRQGSYQTLGSLSTIEVINEEDTKIQSSLEDSIPASLSVDHFSEPSPTSSVRSLVNAKQTSAHKEERQEPSSRSNLNHPMETSDCVKHTAVDPTDQDEEKNSNNKATCSDFVNHETFLSTEQVEDNEVKLNDRIACNLFKEQLIILRESSESPDQTRKALEILAECDTTEDNEGKDNLFIFEAILTSMLSHAFSYDVQLWGCRAIWNISSSSNRVQSVFAHAGAPAVITKAMNQFIKTGEDLQEDAIHLLSKFATNPSNLDNLLCKGADTVESIIMAMGQYPGNAGIQTKGCDALANFALHDDLTLRLRIMEKGAGEAILFNAMAMHSKDFTVQKSALFAVRNLSTKCEENQTRLLELGVVDPILSAMKKHRSVAGLQEAGAGAIAIIAGNNVETKKVIEENGGIKLILRSILDHSTRSTEKECYIRTLLTLSLGSYNGNNPESRSSEENIKAAAAVGSVIDAIDCPQEKNSPSKLALAIDAIVIAMEAHEGVSAVQEAGCVILSGLAELVEEGIAIDSDQTKMDIVDVGALDAINMAMVLHRHEKRVQERACSLLLGLAIEENYAAIIAAIGIQLLEDAADNFPGRCSDLANSLIQRLSEDEGTKED